MKTRNRYGYPVVMTGRARMTYDESPAHKGKLRHSVDFITPNNTPVRAALDGEVYAVKQDSDAGGDAPSYYYEGNYIEIRHENNEFSSYEHLKKDSALVKKGEKVKAGQVIGYTGPTGWLGGLGPHLHFEVHSYYGPGEEDYETLEIVWKEEPSRTCEKHKNL